MDDYRPLLKTRLRDGAKVTELSHWQIKVMISHSPTILSHAMREMKPKIRSYVSIAAEYPSTASLRKSRQDKALTGSEGVPRDLA